MIFVALEVKHTADDRNLGARHPEKTSQATASRKVIILPAGDQLHHPST